VKNKAATDGGKRRAEHSGRRPSFVVLTRRRRSVCDGLDVIRRRRRSNPPDTTPLVITPFPAAVGHRRVVQRYILLKTDTNPYVLLTLSDPRGGVLTPTDPRTAENKGVMT